MTDLNERAAAVFGASAEGVHWPYDVSAFDITLRKRDPAAFRKKLAERTAKREVIVAWAEQHGLKKSTVNCCPWWLTRKVSRTCMSVKCTRYGASSKTVDSGWLEHGICWLKDGKPAVITSAPYHVTDEDRDRLRWWLTTHPELAHAFGEGWYGYRTQQIVLWRHDRIDHVEPAALPEGAEW